jgi:phosphoenolpyruvate---glycerone phosphotransferase subunit DhaM
MRCRGAGEAELDHGSGPSGGGGRWREGDAAAGVGGGEPAEDLGSAVLTVRAVLEDLAGPRVLLADAPFVEGAVAATVTAAAGGDVKAVAAAAEEARHVRKL